jgi:hypothetical protein
MIETSHNSHNPHNSLNFLFFFAMRVHDGPYSYGTTIVDGFRTYRTMIGDFVPVLVLCHQNVLGFNAQNNMAARSFKSLAGRCATIP